MGRLVRGARPSPAARGQNSLKYLLITDRFPRAAADRSRDWSGAARGLLRRDQAVWPGATHRELMADRASSSPSSPPRRDAKSATVQARQRPSSSGWSTSPPRASGVDDEPWVEDTLVRRQTRLEHKMSRALVLVGNLPFDDRRALLLRSALLRRDELLLDAVLADLGADAGGGSKARHRRAG